jgi:hypothetical protein
MCKEMPVIPVNRVVDKKRIIGKNGVPRRRRGTRCRCPKKPHFTNPFVTPQGCWKSNAKWEV